MALYHPMDDATGFEANFQTCPECGGVGEVQIEASEVNECFMARIDEKRGPVRQCFTCEGTGSICP